MLVALPLRHFATGPAPAQSNPTYIQFSPPAVNGALYKPDPPLPSLRVAILVIHRISNAMGSLSCTELSKRGFMVLCTNPRSDNNEALVKWDQIAFDVKSGVNEYPFPMGGGHDMSMDSSGWGLGTGSSMNHVAGVHDTRMDIDGNIWLTYSHANKEITLARIDGKTGAVRNFATQDQKGIAAGTLDGDLNGNIWVTAPNGALSFNIKGEPFTEFKSKTYKNKFGTATGYRLAADRVGNGWRLLMSQDLVDCCDIKTGRTGEFKLEPEKIVLESLTDAQKKMSETFQPPDFNTPFAWAKAPRCIGADKNRDYVWVGNSFGGTMAKINIYTKETTLIPLPDPEAHQPYQVSVDKDHNVWTNLWSTDKWPLYELPIRGGESRHISQL